MTAKYPKFESERVIRGISKKAIYSALGISERCFYNKSSGLVPFTWPEVCIIQTRFFPDISKELLFYSDADCKSAS